MISLIAIATMMSLASCSTESTDTATEEEVNNEYILEQDYNAKNVTNEDESTTGSIEILPPVTVTDAVNLLGKIREHKNVIEELNVTAAESGDQKLYCVSMTQTVDESVSFTIQLNMTGYNDGRLYYSGYETNLTANEMNWDVNGFSLSNDSQTGKYKFSGQSYLYLKVLNNGVKYMQVPVSVNGIYNPETHEASFTYSL